MDTLGKHLLIEYYDCDRDLLNSVSGVEKVMTAAAEACGATIVRSVFHAFNPIGVSGVVVISESHLAVHTWPEHGYAAVDVFTCGTHVDPRDAELYLRGAFRAGDVLVQAIDRGTLEGPGKPTVVHELPQARPIPIKKRGVA